MLHPVRMRLRGPRVGFRQPRRGIGDVRFVFSSKIHVLCKTVVPGCLWINSYTPSSRKLAFC